MHKLLLGLASVFCLYCSTALAAEERATIGLLAAEPQWLDEASVVASALQHHNGMRVLPVLGLGAIQGLSDLSTLDSIDAAILPLDVLTYARAQGLAPARSGGISYLARLQPVTWVLLARKDYRTVADLSGTRLATGPTGSAGFVAGELLFNAANLSFSRVPLDGERALDALRDGKADAALVPLDVAAASTLSATDIHVLEVAVPPTLASTYIPAIMSAANLPHFLVGTSTRQSIAAPLAIMVFDWPKSSARSSRTKRFAKSLFEAPGLEALNTNLAATIPGWKRHASADAALAASSLQAATPQPAGAAP
jgi:uncharacterized protein